MKIQKFNDGWKYWQDKDSFALVWDVPAEAKEITLPHDAMIEQKPYENSLNKGNTGYRDGGIYVYVKNLYVEEKDKDNKLTLKFEGVYMNAFVYINEQLAGKCINGYTTFYVPLNDYLNYDQDNEIRVIVRNGAMSNSRWYTGSGIYRDVYLIESGLVHLANDGVKVSCEQIESDYCVQKVSTTICNDSHKKMNLKVETLLVDDVGKTVSSDKADIAVFANESRSLVGRMVVENPKLWSEHTPSLYKCITNIYENDKLIDASENTFGIRRIHIDTKSGLRVNGEKVNLRGACIHHDSGIIGAVTYYDAEYRRVKRLKQAGFNAIRMAHNPAAPVLLKACDELGVYVMEEAFDMWTRCKSDYDYGISFEENWEKDIEAMVRNVYNHPSVIMYSIGNEIPEIGTDAGVKLCQTISDKIRNMDSTRYTLASVNGVFAAGDKVNEIVADVSNELRNEGVIEGNVNHFMALMKDHMDRIVTHPHIEKRLEKSFIGVDIAGYNYMTARYEPDGEKYPNRIIVGSETYPPEIAKNWDKVNKLNHVIGDFTWTGWDYIGEAGVGIPAYKPGEGGFSAKFPCQLAYCGDFDIIGSRRPASYYREIVFGLREKPYITVQNPNHYGEEMMKTPWIISDSVASWNWGGYERKPIIVEVYAPGDEVELLLNGTSIGKKQSGQDANFIALFETTNEQGMLEAVVYRDGKVISKDTLKTSKNKQNIFTDIEYGKNRELVFMNIEIQDEECELCTDELGMMKIYVEGADELLGFGTGNPKPKYNYNEMTTEMHYGRAMAVFKKSELSKETVVTLEYDDIRIDVQI